jgi:hypothetical protein
VVTFSDWVAGHLGRKVCGGDVLERNGLRVLVRKIRRQKVLEAQLSIPEKPAPLVPASAQKE